MSDDDDTIGEFIARLKAAGGRLRITDPDGTEWVAQRIELSRPEDDDVTNPTP